MANKQSLPQIHEFAKEMANKISIRISVILLTIATSFFFALAYVDYTSRTRKIFESLQGYLNHMLASGDFYEVTRSLNSLLDSKLISGFWIYSLPEHHLKTTGERGVLESSSLFDWTSGSFNILSKHIVNVDSGQKFEMVFSHHFSIWIPLVATLIVGVILFYLNRFVSNQTKALSDCFVNPISELSSKMKLTTFEENKVMLDDENLAFSELKDLQDKFKDLHSRLGETNRELQVANTEKVVSRMAGMIAHDLRAPFSMFSKLLHVKNWNEFVKSKNQLSSALSRCQSLLEALRHNDKEIVISKTFNAEIEFEMLAAEASAYVDNAKKIELDIRYSGTFYLDRPKLERAVSNLIINALEESSKKVTLVVENDKNDLIIRVLDDGKGIDDSFLPSLFSYGKSYAKLGGTGKGLNYVKFVAEAHDGTVTYSRQDELTVFEVRIPDGCLQRSVANNTRNLFRNEDLVNQVLVCLESKELEIETIKKLNQKKISSRSVSLEEFKQNPQRARLVVTDSFDLMETSVENRITSYHFEINNPLNVELEKIVSRYHLFGKAKAYG